MLNVMNVPFGKSLFKNPQMVWKNDRIKGANYFQSYVFNDFAPIFHYHGDFYFWTLIFSRKILHYS